MHIKANYNDDLRRFFFTGNSFTELYTQLQHVYHFVEPVAVKYLDDENELVTISTDPELQFGIEISEKLLRIVVVGTNVPPPPEDQPVKEGCWKGRGNYRGCGRGRQGCPARGRWGHGRGRGRFGCRGQWSDEVLKSKIANMEAVLQEPGLRPGRKANLEKRIAAFKQRLENPNASKQRPTFVEKLQAKLQSVEDLLADPTLKDQRRERLGWKRTMITVKLHLQDSDVTRDVLEQDVTDLDAILAREDVPFGQRKGINFLRGRLLEKMAEEEEVSTESDSGSDTQMTDDAETLMVEVARLRQERKKYCQLRRDAKAQGQREVAKDLTKSIRALDKILRDMIVR